MGYGAPWPALAKAFFYAGARSILVSHWSVASVATVKLVTGTFDELKNDPTIGRAVALRRAEMAMLDPKTHPSSPIHCLGAVRARWRRWRGKVRSTGARWRSAVSRPGGSVVFARSTNGRLRRIPAITGCSGECRLTTLCSHSMEPRRTGVPDPRYLQVIAASRGGVPCYGRRRTLYSSMRRKP